MLLDLSGNDRHRLRGVAQRRLLLGRLHTRPLGLRRHELGGANLEPESAARRDRAHERLVEQHLHRARRRQRSDRSRRLHRADIGIGKDDAQAGDATKFSIAASSGPAGMLNCSAVPCCDEVNAGASVAAITAVGVMNADPTPNSRYSLFAPGRRARVRRVPERVGGEDLVIETPL